MQVDPIAHVQVAMLFRSHKDLLEEFTYFLPDAQAPAQVWTPLLDIDSAASAIKALQLAA